MEQRYCRTAKRQMTGKRRRKKSRMPIVIAIVLLVSTVLLIGKFMLNGVVMDLEEYYPVGEDRIMLIMQNNLHEEQGLYIDGVVYVDVVTVQNYFNPRFYWDANENILIYTTPTEIIKAYVGSKEYLVNKT